MAGEALVTRKQTPIWWTVSTTEMTEEQAKTASALIEVEFPGVHADPVDPSGWFGLYLDRWTTEMVRDALISLRQAGGDVSGLLEDVEEWLDNQATPYPEDALPDDVYKPINSLPPPG